MRLANPSLIFLLVCAPCIMHRCLNSNNRWSPPPLTLVLRIPHFGFLPGQPPARFFPFPTLVLYPVEPPPNGICDSPSPVSASSPSFFASFFYSPRLSLSLSTPISSVIHSSISSVHKALSLSIHVPPSLYTCPTLRLSYCPSGVRGSHDPLFFFWPSDPGKA
jgi:hypothetical protein